MRKTISAIAVLSVAAVAATSVALAAPTRPSAPHVIRPSAVKPHLAVTYTWFDGGATLPAVAYNGTQARTNKLTTVSSADTSTVLGNWLSMTANTYSGGSSYCQTGSGTGKKVIDGVNPANNNCTTGSPLGFSSTNNVSGVYYADFAGSDAPLSVSEYGITLSGRGKNVQVPVIVGAVAIAFNYSPTGTNSLTFPVNATTAKLCSLFSNDGSVTTFGSLFGQASDATPIGKVVYRSDNSGTTFSIANFLENNCGAAPKNKFAVDQSFTNVFSGYGAIPANFSGQSGNTGVASYITSNSNVVGYVEAANIAAAAPVYIAKVNNVDPYAGAPKAAKSIAASGLVANQVLPAFPASPTYPYTPAPQADGDTNGCVVLLKPSAYANVGLTSGAYPIIGVSNLEFSSTGNPYPADLQLLPKKLLDPTQYSNNPVTHGTVTTVDSVNATTGSTGYASLPASFQTNTSITTAIGCIGA